MFGFFKSKKEERERKEADRASFTALTSTELKELQLRCPVDPEDHTWEMITDVLNKRREELSKIYRKAYSEIEQELFSEALEDFTQYQKLAEQWEEHIPEKVVELMGIAKKRLVN